jgi:acetyltransferase-like isoleucine patch superfamily enzyme
MRLKDIYHRLLHRSPQRSSSFYRRYCIIGENSVLHSEAEIFNNLNDKERIIIGDFTHIRGQLLTFGHGGKITIGDYCYVGRNSYVWSAKSVKIGDRVLISHNCNVFDNDTHPLDPVKRHEQFKEIITRGQPKQIDLDEQEIVIQNDVMIGANSIILKGVRVGEAAVVAAGSVVTKDVPDWTVVAGNPAIVINTIPKDDRK